MMKETQEHFSLNVQTLSDEDCQECCGLTKGNLEQLVVESGCSLQVIFEFFCKCRQDISN